MYIHIYISEWRIIHQRRFNYKSEEIHPLNGALNHFVRTNQHFILDLSLQRQQSAITNRNAFATGWDATAVAADAEAGGDDAAAR